MTDSRLEEFLVHVGTEKGLSKNTQMAYRGDLERIHAFIGKNSFPWPPDYETILKFLRFEKDQMKEESSIARALVSIKLFLKFLYREGYLQKDISILLETPKLWKTLPSVLNHVEVERLLQAPNTATDEGLRDYTILELLYGTGMRVSELCGLHIHDVLDNQVKVFGKGGKERIVPLGGKASSALKSYLERIRLQKGPGFLFLAKRGGPLSRIDVWKMVKRYTMKVGIQKDISPHTFRHTYASHLLDAGADLRVIQELLGHAHISSTDRYTHLSKSQVREVFRTFHPRWNAEQSSLNLEKAVESGQ